MKKLKSFDSLFLPESKSSRWPDFNNQLYVAVEKELGELDTSNVEIAFSKFPLLKSIGDEASYTRYLETIFPNSIVKDIVYNSSRTDKNTLWFAKKITHDEISQRFGGFVTMAKVNLMNPDIKLVGYTHRDQFEGDGFISLCAARNSDLQIHRGDELVPYDIRMRSQKQIHILGSQKDLEGFKKFNR